MMTSKRKHKTFQPLIDLDLYTGLQNQTLRVHFKVESPSHQCTVVRKSYDTDDSDSKIIRHYVFLSFLEHIFNTERQTHLSVAASTEEPLNAHGRQAKMVICKLLAW